MTIPLIDTGELRRRDAVSFRKAQSAKYLQFEMKFLEIDSLLDLISLQSVVAANLPCPEIFFLHDEKYLRDVFRHERSVIGVTTQDGLIAFSIIRIPGLADDNLGKDLNLPEEELTKVAHLQAAAVHPAYRGNGLQRMMVIAHMHVIEELGYEHVCCTVSPKNPISLANYLSFGLLIEALRPKMQGWWRYILHKNIFHPYFIGQDGQENKKVSEEIKIQISDIEGQLELLKQGFKGFKVSFNTIGAEIIYAKI